MIGPVCIGSWALVIRFRVDVDSASIPHHPGGCGSLAHWL